MYNWRSCPIVFDERVQMQYDRCANLSEGFPVKVLLCSPPAYIGNHERHFIQAGSRWSFSIFVRKGFTDHYMPYPFGLGYSSAILKAEGEHEVVGLDACALDYDEKQFVHAATRHSPDLLVVDAPTISFPLLLPLLKQIKAETNCKLMLTGGHVTALAREVMLVHPVVDYCALGEYEITVKKVANLVAGTGKLSMNEIDGLAFRNNGNVAVNETLPKTYTLDDLPYPDREDFLMRFYHDFEIAGKPCVQMLTSLGCPYKCTFCMPIRVMHGDVPNYRKREPDNIVDEIENVRDVYGAKQLYFDDDTFAVDKGRIRQMCERMRERHTDVPWTAMGDITLDKRTLEELSKSDCVGLKFGVETSSATTLTEIKKTFVNAERVRRFVRECQELGIWTHATFIVGLPGDHAESIEKTVEFSSDLGLDSVQFSIATPFPGTPFYDQVKSNGWLVSTDWTRFDGANYGVVSYPWLTHTEIERLHRRALQRWYGRALIEELKEPRRIKRILKARSFWYSTRKVLSHLQGTL